MPFILKDETAGVNVLYIDNAGQVGLMGSANSGQALSFAGVGVISNGATYADSIATSGSPSSLTGTLVIPVSSTGTVSFTYPQVPTATASQPPTVVTVTAAQWTNPSSSSTLSIDYNIW